MKLKLILFLVLCYCLDGAAQQIDPTSHKRQFRGVWIASVHNLDWPSKPGLSVRKIKKEYIKQIEKLKELGMNAVIVQIRPTGDAFYPSTYEPWSEFLTGEQGVEPKAGFDPLEFMINETHKRAIEFHAWFNPYRAIRNNLEAKLSPKHIYNQHPDWFVSYGKDMYFDPGVEPARKFVEKVIADVVTRYDIDAVHFDDYYYPYRLEGQAFPDTLSFAMNARGFTSDSKEDWRRDNINLLVHELYDTINQIKPWVHFGISPFGVWRNKSKDPDGSNTETLQTNYDDLYGDAQAWLRNGWLDYIIPQCYQYMGRDIMDYRIVTRWWNDHNYGVNFYIGQGSFRLGEPKNGPPWNEGNEIERQLYFNDSIPRLLGSAYFRSRTFFNNPLGLNEVLKNKFYKYPALPPSSHHDEAKTFNVNINLLSSKISKRKITMQWAADPVEQVRYYVIYQSNGIDDPKNIISITTENKITLKRKSLRADLDVITITAVNRYRVESNPVTLLIDN